MTEQGYIIIMNNKKVFNANNLYQTIGLIPGHYITQGVYIQVFKREGDICHIRHCDRGTWTRMRKVLITKGKEMEFLDYKVNNIKFRANTKILKAL